MSSLRGQGHCCRRPGRPLCGFSRGENAKKGQLRPIAPARLGQLGPGGDVVEPAGHVTACSALALVLTC